MVPFILGVYLTLALAIVLACACLAGIVRTRVVWWKTILGAFTWPISFPVLFFIPSFRQRVSRWG